MSDSRMDVWHRDIGAKTGLSYVAAIEEGKYSVLKTASERLLSMRPKDPACGDLAAVCAGDLARLFRNEDGAPVPFFAGLHIMDSLFKQLPVEKRKAFFPLRSNLGHQIFAAAWQQENFLIEKRLRGMDPLFVPHISAFLQSALFFYRVGKETRNSPLIKTALGSLRMGARFLVPDDQKKLDQWGALFWMGANAFDRTVPLPPAGGPTHPNEVQDGKGRLGACFSSYISWVTRNFPVPPEKKIREYRLEIDPSL